VRLRYQGFLETETVGIRDILAKPLDRAISLCLIQRSCSRSVRPIPWPGIQPRQTITLLPRLFCPGVSRQHSRRRLPERGPGGRLVQPARPALSRRCECIPADISLRGPDRCTRKASMPPHTPDQQVARRLATWHTSVKLHARSNGSNGENSSPASSRSPIAIYSQQVENRFHISVTVRFW